MAKRITTVMDALTPMKTWTMKTMGSRKMVSLWTMKMKATQRTNLKKGMVLLTLGVLC